MSLKDDVIVAAYCYTKAKFQGPCVVHHLGVGDELAADKVFDFVYT